MDHSIREQQANRMKNPEKLFDLILLTTASF